MHRLQQPRTDSTDASNPVCFLFGHTTPFTLEQLTKLYPTQHVQKSVKDSARATREAKFTLAPEEQELVEEAEAAQVPELRRRAVMAHCGLWTLSFQNCQNAARSAAHAGE
jgi:hypothetical protein